MKLNWCDLESDVQRRLASEIKSTLYQTKLNPVSMGPTSDMVYFLCVQNKSISVFKSSA